MARVRPLKNKDGKIISYEIRVFRGKTPSGKELTPYSMTWRIPETYKSESAIKRALAKVVGEFETKCKQGTISNDKRTFQDYAEYFIQLKQRDCKQKTIDFYNSLLPRIYEHIGSIRLSALTAEDLNKFYLKLEDSKIRNDKKAIAKDCLLSLRQEKKYTHKQLETLSGLSKNTVSNAFQQKKIALESAEKIAVVFNKKISDLFVLDSSNSGKGLSAKTIHHYHSLIHDILDLALRESIVIRNVADLAAPPKQTRHEADFFEIDEILKIRSALETAPLKYKAMLYVLIETGCRRGELVGLKWDSINFEKAEIELKNNVQYSSKIGIYENSLKAGNSHTIAISSELTQFLQLYKQEQEQFKELLGIPDFNHAGYLFIQEDGRPIHPDTLYSWMQRFAAANNLPHLNPHKFRHSQASILIASGIDILTISKRLGHSQTSTTQDIYGHLIRKSDRKASDAFIQALKNA